MSHNKAHGSKSNWTLCPADILLVVFKKLDIKSLLNCMNVNIYWRNIVEYYCEHCYLWRAIVQNALDDEGVTFAEKSNLGWRELFLTAQQWLNVRNIKVYLRHCYKFDSSIRNIYVHKDNLTVVTKNTVKFFNIVNFENIKVIDKSCIRYEETSSMIVELSMAPKGKFSSVSNVMTPVLIVLTLTNKLTANYVDSEKVKEIILEDIDSFKVHLNSCYEYSNKVLWMHTAKETGWDTKAMAKYHGIHQFSPAPHFGACVVIHGRRHNHFVTTVDRYGVKCVLEHGHILILGFEDGKIDIYLTRKLIEPSEADAPEVRLNLKDYLCNPNQLESSLSIISLDIYENITGHHLFVATMFNVYELLLL